MPAEVLYDYSSIDSDENDITPANNALVIKEGSLVDYLAAQLSGKNICQDLLVQIVSETNEKHEKDSYAAVVSDGLCSAHVKIPLKKPPTQYAFVKLVSVDVHFQLKKMEVNVIECQEVKQSASDLKKIGSPKLIEVEQVLGQIFRNLWKENLFITKRQIREKIERLCSIDLTQSHDGVKLFDKLIIKYVVEATPEIASISLTREKSKKRKLKSNQPEIIVIDDTTSESSHEEGSDVEIIGNTLTTEESVDLRTKQALEAGIIVDLCD